MCSPEVACWMSTSSDWSRKYPFSWAIYTATNGRSACGLKPAMNVTFSIGACPFPDDRADERQVERDARAGEEIRQRARHAEMAEDLASGRAERLEERDLLEICRAQPDERVNEHRKERDESRDRDLRRG